MSPQWNPSHCRRSRWKCSTPHLNEEDIKRLFLTAVGKLLSDRTALLEDCVLMRDTIADTGAIDRECEKLNEEMDTVSTLTKKLIAENAADAMSQDSYNEKYDSLALRYNTAQERYDTLQRKKQTIAFEVDVIECFMFEIRVLPELPVEFSDHLWNALIDHATVNHDDTIVFSFKNGTDISIDI